MLQALQSSLGPALKFLLELLEKRDCLVFFLGLLCRICRWFLHCHRSSPLSDRRFIAKGLFRNAWQ